VRPGCAPGFACRPSAARAINFPSRQCAALLQFDYTNGMLLLVPLIVFLIAVGVAVYAYRQF
jgi:hypothetical protein